MEIKLLSDKLKTRVSSDVKINNFLQCVTELVFNSLDSKATAIAVRINTLSFQLQVIDNGEGITQENMELIGQRYMTSKCSSLSDLSNRSKYYGYKGESLASIRELSRSLSITSRPAGQGETFHKIFSGIENSVRVHKVKQRSSKGTTFNIEGFLFNHPVRQKRINPEIELEEIKKFLQSIGIIHPDVSLTLRNELTGCVILNHPKSKTVSNAISNLCVNLDRNYLHEIKVKKHNVSVSGLIYTKLHANDKLQFIYVNKRLTELRSLSQLINHAIESNLFTGTGDGDQKQHPVYVLNIACPRFDFDCSQFKNWDILLKCLEKLIGQVSGDLHAEVKCKSLSGIKTCDTSKHMCKKVRSDSTLELKTKSSKQIQIGGGINEKRKQIDLKCVKENKSEDIFEEKSNESSCDSNFLYFQNCNLVGSKSKNVRQTVKVNRKRSEMKKKKKGCECAKENLRFESKGVLQESCNIEQRCKYENVKQIQLKSINNTLQDQKQKRNLSQDFIAEKYNQLNFILCRTEQNKTHFDDDQNQGKEFIMDKFMKSLSNSTNKTEANPDDSEYNILRDVSFVNEKGAKRLEKLNREANLIITNRLENFHCNEKQITPFLETQEQSKVSDSKFIFPDDHKHPSINYTHNVDILYNSIMPYLREEKESHLPFKESKRIQKESTYKSHCNNIFLPDLPLRNEDSEFDVKERFYQTIIKTCKSAKLDDPSRFFTCKSNYILLEDEYEKFKKDLLGETSRALLNKTKGKFDGSFHLNINFTGIYQNERLFEASKMSLFYTSRRISDVTSVSRTQNFDKATKNVGVDDERNRSISAVKLINVNQNESRDEDVIARKLSVIKDQDSLFLVHTNDLNIEGDKNDEGKEQNENLDLNPEENIETLFMDTSVNNLRAQLIEEFFKQNHLDIKGDKKDEGKEQHEYLDSNSKEKIETLFVDTTVQNSEANLRFQLVEEWIKQEESATKIYYLNTRTGMSSSLNRQSPNKFTLKKRPQFIPKGLSPIVKHVKEVDTSLPPSAKGKLQNAIIEVYDNDMEIMKNSSTHIEDLQDFLDKYYEENQKKFCSDTLNAYNKYVSHEMYTFTRNLFDELQIIGQFDLKFIVSHSSSGVIFLFDQHAVCERIQLERLLKDYMVASSIKYKSTQCKEFTIKFSTEDICMINNFKHMFEYLGLCFEALEDRLQIKKVPLCFYNKRDKTVSNDDTLFWLVQNLIHEELVLLRSTRGKFSRIPNCIRDVINSEACRGAVKFGDELSPSDCHKYIIELSKCQLPFHCAHGRPTVIPLVKLRDAKDNLFKRLAAPNLKKLFVNK